MLFTWYVAFKQKRDEEEDDEEEMEESHPLQYEPSPVRGK
jgi:hypothetical protein